MQAVIDDIIQEAASLWAEPLLAKQVEVSFSKRMRASAGRALCEHGIVRLHAALGESQRTLLREVLIHELAHVVVYRRYGPSARPHGPEWQQLVGAAGLEPRVRLPAWALPKDDNPAPTWVHSCPVCHSQRCAKRCVRNWRCARCLEAGLSGELTIERSST